MRRRTSSETISGLRRARETVTALTPARAATSDSFARPFGLPGPDFLARDFPGMRPERCCIDSFFPDAADLYI
jgi:hypothetical protein